MARPQPSGPMVSAIVMATILAIYLVLVGWRALQFLQTGNPVAVVMGSALLVLPLIGAWALWRELWFGMRSAALVRELEAEGGLELGIALGPTRRPTRAGASDSVLCTRQRATADGRGRRSATLSSLRNRTVRIDVSESAEGAFNRSVVGCC